MKTLARTFLLLALTALASACGSESDRNVSTVVIENGVWAEVVQGDTLRVEGDVMTGHDGDILTISPAHGSDAVARVRLPFPWAREIRTRGNAEVVLKPIRFDRLELDAAGTSRIEVSGVAAQLVVRMRGNAQIEASELVAATASIDGSGSSSADITVTVSVEGTLSGNAELVVGGGGSTAELFTQGSADVTVE
ncbi:MAG TPA: DUF2807 domain-containing protein [Thermoanaerobaculia bacterium]|nr:DUF2807 domain-containing protein [Thermoanaerobaculia bacterium]